MAAAVPSAHANSKYAGIVVDHKTGRVLYQENADSPRYPASLTKIMTLYIVFEELEAGRLTYDTRMRVSTYAASKPPSKIYVKAGGTLRVKDAIGALVTKSANDASVVVAEHIAGSEKAFAARMTRTARALGMSSTTFRNANGLPNSGQRTTARDMMTLGRAIQDRFPDHYKWFKTRRYTIGSKTYGNHNRLLGSVSGVDGIKTGYIRASGFNLVTSVKRDGREIVAVVMGGRTGRSRDAHMQDLINRYLKKASKGRRKAPLVASRQKTPTFATAYASVPTANIPTPVARPAQLAAANLASGKPPAAIPAAQPGTRPVPPQPVSVGSNNGGVNAVPAGRPMPLPGIRPRQPERLQVASAASSMPVPTSRIDVAMAIAKGATAREALAPIPPAKVESVPITETAVRSAGASATAQALLNRPASTASVKAPEPAREGILDGAPAGSGWVIQIGAMPNRTEAVQLLEKALNNGGNAVNGATPFIEKAVVKAKTYHRARFAGFGGKSAAQQACKSLEKRNFACYATRG